MSRSCLIISGGQFSPFPPPAADEYVIACDRGYDYACRCGIAPNLVVGDFDSCDSAVAEGIPVRRLPVEKDDTDTLSALRFALDQGFRDIRLVCALGGRLDHLIANLQAAIFAAVRGAQVRIQAEGTELITLRNGSLRLPRREGYSLSVFAAEGICRGVSIRGAKYPLENAELSLSFPLGVSNEWAGAEAEVQVEEGLLLIVLSRL